MRSVLFCSFPAAEVRASHAGRPSAVRSEEAGLNAAGVGVRAARCGTAPRVHVTPSSEGVPTLCPWLGEVARLLHSLLSSQADLVPRYNITVKALMFGSDPRLAIVLAERESGVRGNTPQSLTLVMLAQSSARATWTMDAGLVAHGARGL